MCTKVSDLGEEEIISTHASESHSWTGRDVIRSKSKRSSRGHQWLGNTVLWGFKKRTHRGMISETSGVGRRVSAVWFNSSSHFSASSPLKRRATPNDFPVIAESQSLWVQTTGDQKFLMPHPPPISSRWDRGCSHLSEGQFQQSFLWKLLDVSDRAWKLYLIGNMVTGPAGE